MYSISIPVPPLEAEQVIEVEVKIGGKSQRFNYRVETYEWGHHPSADERVEGLKQFLAAYDSSWQLVEIGNPTRTLIPLMFRQKKGA